MGKKLVLRWLLSLAILPAMTLHSQAQDLGHLGKQKPFAITGSVGGGLTFYNSNQSANAYIQDPFTWNLYGNFTASIYSVALPFSFVVNQYSRSYTSPFAQFGISPTYKWIKLDLGYRYIEMSPFTFSGQSFKGVGIELNPKGFRFAAFYGSLNKAINEDTTSGHLAMPQYGRKGYGIKLGVGTDANHFDLIWFHAKDDSSSIRLFSQNDTIRPQENTVLGASMKFTFLKKIVWSTDLAVSALSQDLSASRVNKDTLNTPESKLFYSLIDYRNNTLTGLAGQTLVTLLLKGFNTSIGYRRVESDFQSLGTPYMLNDIEAWQWNAGAMLAGGKLNLNANLNAQHNDISKKLLSELHTLTASLSLGGRLGTKSSFAGSISVVNMQQTDGLAPVSDTVRLNQQVINLSLTPNFVFGKTTLIQTLTPSVNFSLLDDHNPFTAPNDKGNTLTLNLNYSCNFVPQSWSLTGSLLLNRYTQDTSVYTSYGINAGGAVQLLKDKSLGFQLTLGYLINHFSQGNAQNNITGAFNAHYLVKKKHSFSGYFNYTVTPPNNLGLKVPYAVNTTNVGGGLSYNYSF